MYVLKDIGNHYDISMISIRIRERRTQKGYTQQELADKIGVQRQAIINWENTKKNILPSAQKSNQYLKLLITLESNQK